MLSRNSTRLGLSALTALTGALFVLAGVLPASAQGESELYFELAPATKANPPLPDPTVFPVQLVVDDDNAEGVFGLNAPAARQFLFFNSFASAGEFLLEEIWVLFPATGDAAVGDGVQILVYLDPDSNPANGAQLLGSFNQTVQAADGNTFSIYSLGAGIPIAGPGDVLIGVVNRYFTTGVDPAPTVPAALDTTATQNRSYFALWAGDPPDPPDLASATTVDLLAGLSAGNLMIRGFGTPAALPAVTEVPTAGTWALIVLAGLLGWVAVRFLRFG